MINIILQEIQKFRAEFVPKFKSSWLLWLLIFLGITYSAFVFHLFNLHVLLIILLIILIGIRYNMQAQTFLAILAISFTGTSIVTQIRQFQISNNAILFFGIPVLNENEKKISIPMGNLGNTMASDFKAGAVLVRILSDEEKIKENKDYVISSAIINPDVDIYPKETMRLPMTYPDDGLQLHGTYFMICYLKYTTFCNEQKDCERWYQCGNNKVYYLSKNQPGVARYKTTLDAVSKHLKELISNNQTD